VILHFSDNTPIISYHRFCQMAKLTFDKDDKICILEEYVQSMTGSGVRWPGIGSEISDEYLVARLKQEDIVPNKATCNECKMQFSSRSQLFIHLKSTEPDGEGKCVQIQQSKEESVWVCMSLGYLNSDCVEDDIRRALTELAKELQQSTATINIDLDSLTWAILPSYSSSAVVNIASIKLSKQISVDSLPSMLNNKLQSSGIRIHTAVVVERPCVQDRREFEKYEAFIPWRALQGQDDQYQDTKQKISTTNNKRWSKTQRGCRKPLSETAAFQYVDPEMAKRLRNGARLLKDCGRTDLGHFADNPQELKVRIRTSTMEEPLHHLCRISISMRQPRKGIVERILRLLLSYARSAMDDEELASFALQVTSHDYSSPSTITLQQYVPPICLLEPDLTKYEGKTGIKLSGNMNKNTTKISEETERSIELMEITIIDNLSIS